MNFELLSPAGNLEKMKTALAFGADAVYAGIPDFSLRVRINDFDFDKIKEATEYCHERGKRIYITVNIFAHNKHLSQLPAYIKKLKKIKVDALIVSDPGIISLVKENWPDAEIHLSTQANCTNYLAAKFWFEAGVKRIVLGREVTLSEIKEIHKHLPAVELEYFVHGAMCMTYSGRCFLSKMYLDRSANLGDCVQPCRWEYDQLSKRGGPASGWRDEEQALPEPSSKSPLERGARRAGCVDTWHERGTLTEAVCVDALELENSKTENNSREDLSSFIKAKGHDEILEVVEEEHGSYILNSKDLCLVEHLQELISAGVSSFKIEGRAKSAYYQAMVSGIYSQALRSIKTNKAEEINFLRSELETKLVHRGYTKGFLFGEKADQNLANSHTECAWEFCGQVQSITNYQLRITNDLEGFVLVRVHNVLKVGDEIEIVRPFYDIIKMKVGRLVDSVSGEELSEAHGGQKKAVLLFVGCEVPEFSVIRRRIV